MMLLKRTISLLTSPIFFCFILLPLHGSSQDLSGVWVGTMYNDTTHEKIHYELAINESDGKADGFSHTTFIIDGVKNIGVKQVKIKTKDGEIFVEDEKFVYNNYSEPPAKGVKMSSSLLYSKNDSADVLRGTWKTNATRVFRPLTGTLFLERKKKEKPDQTLIVEKLKDLGLAGKLSFLTKESEELAAKLKAQKAKEEADSLARVKAQKEQEDLAKAEQLRQQKAKEEADSLARVKAQKEQEELAKAEQLRQQKAKEEADSLAKIKAQKEQEELAKAEQLKQQKAKEAADSLARVKAQKEQEELAKAEQLRQQKAKEEADSLAKVKAQKEKEELAKAEQLKQQKAKEEADRLAKLKAQKEREDLARAEQIRQQKAKEEADRLAKLKAQRQQEDLAKAEQLKQQKAKEEAARIAMLKAQQEEADRLEKEKRDKAAKAAADLASRKIETIRSVEISQDSLVLSLYDNGVVDGDTVTVLVNGKVFMPRVMLLEKATNKTLYLTPNMGDTISIIMYAENLGSIPPNTGLLVVREKSRIYEIRFSGDLNKNAEIRLIRKRKE